jgi:DNA repair protein RadA/Sms
MAKKQITAYVCTECGADSPRWAGQCTSCGEWNVIKEIRLGTDKKSRTDLSGYANERSEVKLLSDVNLVQAARIPTGFVENTDPSPNILHVFRLNCPTDIDEKVQPFLSVSE